MQVSKPEEECELYLQQALRKMREDDAKEIAMKVLNDMDRDTMASMLICRCQHERTRSKVNSSKSSIFNLTPAIIETYSEEVLRSDLLTLLIQDIAEVTEESTKSNSGSEQAKNDSTEDGEVYNLLIDRYSIENRSSPSKLSDIGSILSMLNPFSFCKFKGNLRHNDLF